MFRVFYAWQSDLPNPTNRRFIQSVLDKVAAALSKDPTVEAVPIIDRDTANLPGSPHIARSIVDKICSAQAFVGDLSIIGSVPTGKVPRPVPNPNVLIETGIALQALGDQRVLLVVNTAYSESEDLPFDLRHMRHIPYRLEPSTPAPEKTRVKGQLVSDLTKAIKAIYGIPAPSVQINKEETRYYLSERCDELSKSHGPKVEGVTNPKICVHVIPARGLYDDGEIRLPDRVWSAQYFDILEHASTTTTVNIDGFVRYSQGTDLHGGGRAYCILYRSGIVESVLSANYERLDNVRSIPQDLIIEAICNNVPKYIQGLTRLHAQGPFLVALSFINMKGYQFAPSSLRFRSGNGLDRDIAITPFVVVSDEDMATADSVLKAKMDALIGYMYEAFGKSNPFQDEGSNA